MTRPPVSVVMPFAGDRVAAVRALEALHGLEIRAGDELILADNVGTVPDAPGTVEVVRATGEQSPAHARNAGAARAGNDWILFLDSDCEAPPELLERYFEPAADDRIGALAGEIVPAGDAGTLAERYASARNFLGQRAHLAHPYLPRAAAANLLVRADVFAALDGFVEGVRAAEDTDFCWRLQQAGWRLELRAGAVVAHRYRTSLRALGRQWRSYAAGRAWLHRRYPDFRPQPALTRALRRALRRALPRRLRSTQATPRAASPAPPPRRREVRWLAIDAWLAVQELIGFMQSNDVRRAR